MFLRGIAIALLLAGCYETPKPACAFLCGTGGACPDGYACSTDDNRCHLMESGGALARCPDKLIDAARAVDSAAAADANGPDATPLDAMPLDAHPLDAMPLDAMPLDAPPPDA